MQIKPMPKNPTIVICLFFVFFLNTEAQDTECFPHIVKPGETLFSISARYKLRVSQILSSNPELGKKPHIVSGQKLCIPIKLATISKEQINEAQKITHKEETSYIKNPIKEENAYFHIVQKGEAFYEICKKYQLLAYDLISANNLTNTLLEEGQKLLLPPNATIPEEAKSNSIPKNTGTSDIKTEPSKVDNMTKPLNEAKVYADTPQIKHHIVKPGENFYAIARKYFMKPSELKEINKLTTLELKAGQKLKVYIRDSATLTQKTPEKQSADERKELTIKDQNDEDKIPDNAVVIHIAKEIAKSKDISTKTLKNTSNQKNKADVSPTQKDSSVISKSPDLAQSKENLVDTSIRHSPLAGKSDTKSQQKVKSDIELFVPSEISERYKTKDKVEEKASLERCDTINMDSNSRRLLAEKLHADIAEKKEEKAAKPVIIPKPVLPFSQEYANDFQNKNGKKNLKVVKLRGMGQLHDGNIGNEYLAFCSKCEAGTIIKVTNLMSKKHVFVKILGESKNGNLVEISRRIANDLEIFDDLFLAEIALHTSK
ncbi:MAG: LysM peptidoglycan-binding domain-containing protein [Chitinophagales bacterium]|nr:LysM peptidoglycan-binding domain-containing protein [Chitinophagales bacterium]MDW8274429.1 LysM peptidoglycan-binding domain-containing protein [Chitinophagales bacterium]